MKCSSIRAIPISCKCKKLDGLIEVTYCVIKFKIEGYSLYKLKFKILNESYMFDLMFDLFLTIF